MKLSKTEAAWLAGIFDGEGCIAIYKTYNWKYKIKGIKKIIVRPMVVVVNTNKSIIDELDRLYKKLGIKFVVNKMKRAKRNWKPCFRVVIQAKGNTSKILRSILPFLISKKEQAKIVIRFSERPDYMGNGYKDILKDVKRIKILNKRGSL